MTYSNFTGIISRAIRCSIRSSPIFADDVTIHNCVNCTMQNLQKVKIISNFHIEDTKIIYENSIIGTRSGNKNPGELFYDFDGKINGLVISTNNNNQTFSFLKSVIQTSRVIIVKALVNLVEHENYLQIYIEENCL